MSLVVHPVGPVHTWLMHWCPEDTRTVPCVMVGCPHCARFTTRRPLSYLAVLHYRLTASEWLWGPSVLEVPLTTGMQLNELRGRGVALKRQRPRGPIIIGSFEPRGAPPDIKPFDIVGPLSRLWRLPPGSQLRLMDPAELSMWNVAHD